MKSVDEIYEMLNWRSHFGVQLRGIKLAKKLDDISTLIQPKADISVWENCARVLYELSDERLEPYLLSLLEWIEDLNWPGALIILDRLRVFSGEKLKDPFLKFVDDNIKLNNEKGLMWLDYLSELLDNESLKKELPEEVLNTLQKHYHNWGWWDEE